MKRIQRILSILLTLSVFCMLTACSVIPKNAKEIPDDISVVGERAPDSQEAQERRKKELEAIAAEPYPPYQMNAGDIYWIKVYDNPELDVQDTVITPDGYLSVGMIGPVKVANMRIDAATKMIEDRLKEYIKHPKVILIPRIINSQLATLAGKVVKSGQFPINGQMRLSDLIALGQGFPNNLDDGRQMELSDLESSLFVRDGKILPIDFMLALRGDPLHNVRIRGGDYVFIATRTNRMISVIGEVNIPKYVTWYDNIGILEAISNTRGLKDEHSQYALVIRGSMANPEIYRADLKSIMAGQKRNPKLQPGDILYIPKDGISEYNVFIRKLLPTGQLINMLITPGAFFTGW